ncbi:MAG: hypothetical protein E7643_02180 [Ruminococcaceae bacterium]|nr:hypothetical protein [Oscillospiraceae bacterium]
MQTNNLASAIKGQYKHEQTEGFLMAREYIFLKENGKKCLLQRFLNETPREIQRVKFDLVELNMQGEVIKKTKLYYMNLAIKPGEYFSMPAGIVVSPECVDFKIARCTVCSEGYVWRVKRGKIQAYYDRPRRRRVLPQSMYFRTPLSVRSCRPSVGPLYGVLALLAFLSSIGVSLYYLFFPYLS